MTKEPDTEKPATTAPDSTASDSADTSADGFPERRSTAATRTLGGLTTVAVAACVALAVRRPWTPSGDPLLVKALTAALASAALGVIAGFLSPRPAPAAPGDPDTPRPTTADVRAAATRIRRRAWRQAVGLSALVLIAVAAVPAMDAPFTGAPPEAAERRVALDEAGARWGDFELLPPTVNGDPLPAYPRYARYRLGPLGDTPGGPIELYSSAATEGLPVGARLRILYVPGQSWPGPLTDREIEPFLEPAPLHRTAARIWAAVALAAALIALAAGRASGGPPTRRQSEAFLTGPLRWARVSIPGTVEKVEHRTADGESAGTTRHLILEQPAGTRWWGDITAVPRRMHCPDLENSPHHLTPATGWLAWNPAGHRALLALDHGTAVWGSVPSPTAPTADAAARPDESGLESSGDTADGDPVPGLRVLTPPPVTQQPWAGLFLLVIAGWPAGWLLYQLLAEPGRIVPAEDYFGELVVLPLVLGMLGFVAFVLLGMAAAGVLRLVQRLR
ncbi:hypothetical protein [Kitasatospora sp. NPDC090091]|uniref:hypothetical protein n=1 Tax=Kitasatospora sp. NPDC090091 TaxID=3364081 RepID=UPI00380CEE3F